MMHFIDFNNAVFKKEAQMSVLKSLNQTLHAV